MNRQYQAYSSVVTNNYSGLDQQSFEQKNKSLDQTVASLLNKSQVENEHILLKQKNIQSITSKETKYHIQSMQKKTTLLIIILHTRGYQAVQKAFKHKPISLNEYKNCIISLQNIKKIVEDLEQILKSQTNTQVELNQINNIIEIIKNQIQLVKSILKQIDTQKFDEIRERIKKQLNSFNQNFQSLCIQITKNKHLFNQQNGLLKLMRNNYNEKIINGLEECKNSHHNEVKSLKKKHKEQLQKLKSKFITVDIQKYQKQNEKQKKHIQHLSQLLLKYLSEQSIIQKVQSLSSFNSQLNTYANDITSIQTNLDCMIFQNQQGKTEYSTKTQNRQMKKKSPQKYKGYKVPHVQTSPDQPILKQQLTNQQDKAKHYQTMAQLAQNKIKQMEYQINNLNNIQKKFKQQNQILKIENQQLIQQLTESKIYLQTKEDQIEQKINLLNSYQKNLSQQIRIQQSQKAQSQKTYQNLKTQYIGLTSSLQIKKSSHIKSLQKINKYQQELAQTKILKKSLQQQLVQQTNEKLIIKQLLKNSQKNIELSKKNQIQSRQKCKNKQLMLSISQKQFSQAKLKLDQSQSSIYHFNNQLSNLKISHNQRQEIWGLQNKELTAKVSSLKCALNVQKVANQKQKKQNNWLTKQNDQMKLDIRSKQEMIEFFKAQIEQIKEKIIIMQTTNKQNQQIINQFNILNSKLKISLNQNTQQNVKLNELNSELRRCIKNQQQKIRQSQLTNNKLLNFQKQIISANSKLQKQVLQDKKMLTQSRQAIDNLYKQNISLKQQLKQNQEIIRQSKQSQSKYKEKINQLLNKLEQEELINRQMKGQQNQQIDKLIQLKKTQLVLKAQLIQTLKVNLSQIKLQVNTEKKEAQKARNTLKLNQQLFKELQFKSKILQIQNIQKTNQITNLKKQTAELLQDLNSAIYKNQELQKQNREFQKTNQQQKNENDRNKKFSQFIKRQALAKK